MSSKLTRKLLKATEGDLLPESLPLLSLEKNKSATTSTNKQNNKTKRQSRTKDATAMDQRLQGKQQSVVTLSEEDIIQMNVQSILSSDKMFGMSSKSSATRYQKKKKGLDQPSQILLNELDQKIKKQTVYKKEIRTKSLIQGTCRSTGVKGTIQHIPTFNKHKYEKDKAAKDMARLAKKLQAYDLKKKRTK